MRSSRFKRLALLLLLLMIASCVVLTRGPAAPLPAPKEGFAFAAMGDAPYFLWEDLQYKLLLKQLDSSDLHFVAHIGDLFWRPCSESMLERSRGWFDSLRHPLIFTPGDNEWTDCWEPGSGGYDPLERLAALRKIFYDHPERSLGKNPLPLQHQAGEFIENARWEHDGVLFATLHLVGSYNGYIPFEGRTKQHDRAAEERTAAAVEWLQESFHQADRNGARAIVLFFHANLSLESSEAHAERKTYDPFILALEELVELSSRPVLAIHGDDHELTIDRPLRRRTTGEPLPQFQRLQVPGSPDVGWVRVVIPPGPQPEFQFDVTIVPRWKYW